MSKEFSTKLAPFCPYDIGVGMTTCYNVPKTHIHEKPDNAKREGIMHEWVQSTDLVSSYLTFFGVQSGFSSMHLSY